ncbi:hypothetical protein D3C74_438950 [compost metagenome]
MLQRAIYGSLKLGRIFYTYTFNAHCLCHHREVWIHKLCPRFEETGSFHLQLYKAECTIVKHNHFDWKVMLLQREQISHKHR